MKNTHLTHRLSWVNWAQRADGIDRLVQAALCLGALDRALDSAAQIEMQLRLCVCVCLLARSSSAFEREGWLLISARTWE